MNYIYLYTSQLSKPFNKLKKLTSRYRPIAVVVKLLIALLELFLIPCIVLCGLDHYLKYESAALIFCDAFVAFVIDLLF